jgi:hypothetical protein
MERRLSDAMKQHQQHSIFNRYRVALAFLRILLTSPHSIAIDRLMRRIHDRLWSTPQINEL